MDRLFHSMRPLIRRVVQFAPAVLVVAIVLSALGLQQAMKLSIDTDLANLIPPEYPSVQALEKLRETVGGESEASIGIQSPSFEANRRFAEDLIPRVLAMRPERAGAEPYFQRVEYRKDVEFLKDNALYFATSSELDMLEEWLLEKIEESRLDANPFFFDLEDEDEDGEDSVEEPDSLGRELEVIYDDIVSKEYPISDDSTTMVLQFYPAEASTNIAWIEEAYAALDLVIAELNPESYHPSMQVTTAGRLLRSQIEVQTIQRDVLNSFGSGVSAVLLMVILYFLYKSYRARAGSQFSSRVLLSEILRIPVMAVLIGVPLLMSLSWTFGVAYVRYEELNLMTSTLGLVLFGLGIDFGIHFFARYAEERAEGLSVTEAAETTFTSTGQAITIGALTTSLALYVLVAADFRGFSQFGFMAGTGIVFALIAMLIVLPALIAVMERFRWLNMQPRQEGAGSSGASSFSGRSRYPAYRGVVITSALLVV
ncbi:MAG: MMPL family transporter, partial [Rhodothermales bacterium]|nr:MMPL family transporter [Rhodothermales bacterium]